MLTEGYHGEHSCNSQSNSSWCRPIINPEADPRQHDNQQGWQIHLENIVRDIPGELEVDDESVSYTHLTLPTTPYV